MEMNGAQLIVKLLERQGTSMIWGIPGGATLPLYDALSQSPIRHILTRHEQGAGFMAQGRARTTGRAAVCTVTSGPGSTNLITALADAHLDSVPMVAITGQVPTGLMGTDAFQEIDTYGLTLPVTKHNFLVKRAEDLLTVIPEAFCIAESGRPGPVVIDVPKDVQAQKIRVDQWPEPGVPKPPQSPDARILAQAAQMIEKSKRPLFYVGGGVVASGAAGHLRCAAQKNGIPVVSTLMGLGAMAYDDPLFLGMLGMHGTPVANLAMARADLIIALGIRFDDRATGKLAAFCSEAAVIHVDVDESEIGKIRNASLGVCGDAATVLSGILPHMEALAREEWQGEIACLKVPATTEEEIKNPSHPSGIIRYIGNQVPKETIVATDVGQHQMWTAQAYPVRRPRSLLMSGGLGTMGFGLPVAMGAAFANPGKKIVCITGDGSFQMNLQELATLSEHDLNITIVLMDNGHLGLVRQQQEMLYHNQIFASKFTRSPDFCAIAKGFGIRTWNGGMNGANRSALDAALAFQGPSLVVVPIDGTTNVYPMVPPGASNIEMIQEA